MESSLCFHRNKCVCFHCVASADVLVHILIVLLGLSYASAASGKKYVAEGYIVFEDSVLDLYRPHDAVNAKRDLLHDNEYLFTFSNYLYSTLQDYGLNIELRFIEIDVLDINVLKPRRGETELNKSDVIKQFRDWLKKTGARKRLNYDFALLFSGKKLGGINGIASTGVICRKEFEPTGVITFGAQATAVTQAHEIGHIFGALHNGKEGHHVMRSARSYDYMDRFTFSECTAFDIKQYLEKYGDACLLDTKSKSWAPNLPVEKYNGRLFNEDIVCRQVYGPGSFACNIPKTTKDYRSPDEDPDCLFIYCQDPKVKGRLSCRDAQTPEGMPCDHDKVCSLGKCVPNSSSKFARAIEPGCMLGDQEVVFLGGRKTTCEQAYNQLGPDMCDESHPKQYQCCNFCAQKQRGATRGGCLGDFKSVNVDNVARSCSDAVRRLGRNNLCKDSYGSKRCCKTCANLKISDDCYGDESYVNVDKEPKSCSEALRLATPKGLCGNSYGNRRCCKSCAGYNASRGKRSFESLDLVQESN
ncbi:hypothetical protein RRG08_001034 [Elysia crispata]|uniref:Peptidase M12B domain-containing protein n=1 Tax=Elysia crispata TaxID=231223 RepID=A0AAE1AX04_9GAST|nr:hypothetical protein RRG08_001034 [Elysia crispata]